MVAFMALMVLIPWTESLKRLKTGERDTDPILLRSREAGLYLAWMSYRTKASGSNTETVETQQSSRIYFKRPCLGLVV